MKIPIYYDSCWHNSFLASSNNESPPKTSRKFIASSKALKNDNNYIERETTLDTIMGVLYCLIGDQRKLYQARKANDYYFKDIEQYISFNDDKHQKIVSNEVVYLRNLTNSTDQNSFTGMIQAKHSAFKSKYSAFWGVLALKFDELLEFILNEEYEVKSETNLDPLTIVALFEDLEKSKVVENIGKAGQAANVLQTRFTDFKPLDCKRKLKVFPMYCSALYLQLERLEKENDMTSVKSKTGKITGIAKNSFTAKDFMANYTTGKKKLVYGNPYIKDKSSEGEGEIDKMLKKSSGKLIINLNISRDKALELKQLIENAGVSAFQLGKKGLAYVSKITI